MNRYQTSPLLAGLPPALREALLAIADAEWTVAPLQGAMVGAPYWEVLEEEGGWRVVGGEGERLEVVQTAGNEPSEVATALCTLLNAAGDLRGLCERGTVE